MFFLSLFYKNLCHVTFLAFQIIQQHMFLVFLSSSILLPVILNLFFSFTQNFLAWAISLFHHLLEFEVTQVIWAYLFKKLLIFASNYFTSNSRSFFILDEFKDRRLKLLFSLSSLGLSSFIYHLISLGYSIIY